LVSFTVQCDSVLRNLILVAHGDTLKWVRPDGSASGTLSPFSGSASLSPRGDRILHTSSTFFPGIGSFPTVIHRWVESISLGTLLTPLHFTNDSAEWSPDGTRIALMSTQSGERQVHTIRPDGSDFRRLSQSNRRELNVRWAPDGQRLVVGRITPAGRGELVMLRADGSGEEPPFAEANLSLSPLDWSPDGTRLLYDFASSTVGVMNTDGSNRAQLHNRRAPARWSPDGSRVAFARSAPDASGRLRWEVVTMNPDGSDTRPILTLTSSLFVAVRAWR
jgi:Tol biopolymer transport system component